MVVIQMLYIQVCIFKQGLMYTIVVYIITSYLRFAKDYVCVDNK